MSNARTRDDFYVWALAEADIARRALGLESNAVDWHRVVALAQAERERGTPEREIDWKKIVVEAAGVAVSTEQPGISQRSLPI